MRVMSSKTGKPNFPKPLSSWLPTSESSCQEHPFRWDDVRWYCTSLLVCLLVEHEYFFPSPEQCPGALVIVWLSHAGLPWNRTAVCCSIRKTNPGQSGRQKFLARTGGRCVGSVSSKYHLSWCTISMKRFIKIRSLTVVLTWFFFF